MAHPLETVMREADGFLLIGESSKGRFPAYSYHVYTKHKRRFYCLDLDGLTESRGKTAGGPVYASVAELPAERGDLAIVWTHPHSAARAVDLAHEAGCTRVWFSFGAGHRDGTARARKLGLDVVEVGRCPVYYLDGKTPECVAHTLVVKVSGTYGRPPQTDSEARPRVMW